MNFPFSLEAEHLIPLSLSALAVAVPVAWLAGRARSFFPLRYRLWRLMHRKDDAGSEWMDESIGERMELMKFRALLMWADSHPQARRIEAWAKKRGVDVGTLGECGTYFDRVKLELRDKLPTRNSFSNGAFVLVYVACVFMLLGVTLVRKDEAIDSLKSNGRWFDISKFAAHPVASPHYSAMTLADCDKGQDPAGFGEDRAVMCDILRDPHLPASVDQDLVAEHVAGGALCVLGAFILLLLYRQAMALRSAHAVRDQLDLYVAQSRPVPTEAVGERGS